MRTEAPNSAPLGAIRAVPVRHPLRWAAAAVVLVLAAMFAHMLVTNPNLHWAVVRHYLTSAHVLSGVITTLWLTAAAMGTGIAGGVILALMRLSANPMVAAANWSYTWFFRGTPVLVQLIFWYNLQLLIGNISLGIPFGPAFATFDTNTLVTTYMAAVLGLGDDRSPFAFGGLAVTIDPGAKEVLLPFSHLQGNPSERVAQEEKTAGDELRDTKITGATWYMTHNTQVSIFTVALGITFGVGTVIMLFYNGVILGAVALDYVRAGQSTFLLAWLSPHGVIEIPAILLAGQAGLVLAGALIGWGKSVALRTRLRNVSGDLTTLCFGVALLLVWAGFIEAFVSQYHEPILPYSFKIGFALVEFFLLVLLLARSGAKNGGSPSKRNMT